MTTSWASPDTDFCWRSKLTNISPLQYSSCVIGAVGRSMSRSLGVFSMACALFSHIPITLKSNTSQRSDSVMQNKHLSLEIEANIQVTSRLKLSICLILIFPLLLLTSCAKKKPGSHVQRNIKKPRRSNGRLLYQNIAYQWKYRSKLY